MWFSAKQPLTTIYQWVNPLFTTWLTHNSVEHQHPSLSPCTICLDLSDGRHVSLLLFISISFPVLLNFIVMSLFAINRRLAVPPPTPALAKFKHFKFPFWTLLFVKSQWGSICNFEHEENSLIWKVYGYQLQFWSHHLDSISKQRFLIFKLFWKLDCHLKCSID